MSQFDPRLSKVVTAHSSIVGALNVIHSLRTRGLRRTLLFAALGNGIPILGELLAIHVLKVIRHHIQPQISGVPLAIALGWYNVGYGALATVNGAFNDGDKPRVRKGLIPIVALAATNLDLLLDPFGLDLGLWEWSEGGSYASEVRGLNGKRGIPLLNFAGWIALTTGVMLAYQQLRLRDATADERTRTAYLISLRVIGQALQGAVRCVRRTRVVIRCRFDGAAQTFPSG